ncbi:hypothetical protein vseg_011488 [Gypsophila vaccaria]
MATEENPTQTKPSLHPVYTVHNIQHKVRVLDDTKVTYASWVHLFKLHARGYKVLHHIDGTESPAKTDPDYNEWCEIDSHVLQWIYGTLSNDLLARVLTDDSTAYAAWSRDKNIFLNNKGARAASLEHEFTNLKLESLPSLDAYFQRLHKLAGQLSDVDAPVTEQRLVIQLLCGLPQSYDTVASYINQALPDFETARNMLELERPDSPVVKTTLLPLLPLIPHKQKHHLGLGPLYLILLGLENSIDAVTAAAGRVTVAIKPLAVTIRVVTLPGTTLPRGYKTGHHLPAPTPHFPAGLMLGSVGLQIHLPHPPPPVVDVTGLSLLPAEDMPIRLPLMLTSPRFRGMHFMQCLLLHPAEAMLHLTRVRG